MDKRLVYIETYGCQMNKLDSELVMGNILSDGRYQITCDESEADIILINTCSVRKHAEDRVFSRLGVLRKLKNRKPELIIGVIGCMAENYGNSLIERFPQVSLVCAPRKLGAITRVIAQIQETGVSCVLTMDEDDEFCLPVHHKSARQTSFQAYIKVSEGCNLACSYCIVPIVRGREKSFEPGKIVDEAKRLADEGVVEITLLGQTVDSYGLRLKPPTNLAELFYRISQIEAIRRIRFITSHPNFFKKNIMEAIRDIQKVCRYVHLPIQSGSNRILKLMRRGYRVERYKEIVAQLRQIVDGVAISNDFIVGFPSETQEDFEQSIKLMQEIGFQNCFVFKYSPRPKTPAHNLTDDVPYEEKRKRNNLLLEIQKKISLENNQRYIGKEVEILVEGPSRSNPQRQSGRTDTNLIVIFEHPQDLSGKFVKVRIEYATALSLYGKICNVS